MTDTYLPDPALVAELAARVETYLGTRRTGKATFADILDASDADGGWPEIEGLGDGQLELLLDDIHTEIG